MALLFTRVAADLDARHRESAEESLVDVVHLMAAAVEEDLKGGARAGGRRDPGW